MKVIKHNWFEFVHLNKQDDLFTASPALMWLRRPFLLLDLRAGFIVEFACSNM